MAQETEDSTPDANDVVADIEETNIDNYRAVAYFDTGWLPFGKEGISEIFNSFADFIFTINKFLVGITDTGIDYLYSLDALNEFSSKASEISQSLFSSLGAELLIVVFIIAGVYIFILYASGNSAKSAKKALVLIISVILAYGFFANSDKYFNITSGITNSIEGLILSSMNFEDSDYDYSNYDNAIAEVRNKYFDMTVYKPYLLMNYGTVSENDILEDDEERISSLLELDNTEDNADKIEKITEQEVDELDNQHMSSATVLNKIGISIFATVNTLILSVIYLTISLFKLAFHSIAMVLLVVLPLIYIASILINSGISFIKALGTTFGYILLSALSALLFGLLSLFIYIADTLVPITSMNFFFLNSIVFYVILLLVWKKRSQLMAFATSGNISLNPSDMGGKAIDKTKNLGKQLGSFAVAGGVGSALEKRRENKRNQDESSNNNGTKQSQKEKQDYSRNNVNLRYVSKNKDDKRINDKNGISKNNSLVQRNSQRDKNNDVSKNNNDKPNKNNKLSDKNNNEKRTQNKNVGMKERNSQKDFNPNNISDVRNRFGKPMMDKNLNRTSQKPMNYNGVDFNNNVDNIPEKNGNDNFNSIPVKKVNSENLNRTSQKPMNYNGVDFNNNVDNIPEKNGNDNFNSIPVKKVNSENLNRTNQKPLDYGNSKLNNVSDNNKQSQQKDSNNNVKSVNQNQQKDFSNIVTPKPNINSDSRDNNNNKIEKKNVDRKPQNNTNNNKSELRIEKDVKGNKYNENR